MTKKSHSKIKKNNEFNVGEHILVHRGSRKMIASVVMSAEEVGAKNMIAIEDNDGNFFEVPIKLCEKICENCGGSGVLTTPAKQEAGMIIDEIEEKCKSCGGDNIL